MFKHELRLEHKYVKLRRVCGMLMSTLSSINCLKLFTFTNFVLVENLKLTFSYYDILSQFSNGDGLG